MQSKKSFFNKQLVFSDWKHYWPLLFSYVFTWVLIYPLHLWSARNSYWISTYGIRYALERAVYDGMEYSVFMSVVWACFFAMTVFSYLMKGNSTGMMHSLPLTRKTHYASHMLSAVTMMSAGNLITFIFSILMQLPYGVVCVKETLLWLLVTELLNLFFFSFAVLCTHMTGWLLAVPIIYGGLNCAFIVFVTLLQTIASESYYGFHTLQTPGLVKWLTPVYKASSSLARVNYTETGIQKPAVIMLCIYTIVAILFCAAAYALYKNRKSETASDPIVFQWLKPVALYVITFCSALVLGMLIQIITGKEGWLLLLIYEVVCGLVVYFAVLMLLRKEFSVFDRKGLLGAAVVPVVLVVLMVGIRMDVTGYQKHIPSTDSVSNVTLYTRAFEYNGDNEDAINQVARIHSEILKEWESGESEALNEWDNTIQISYTMKNGSVIERYYYTKVRENSLLDQELSVFINTPLVRNQRLNDLQKMTVDGELKGGYVELYRDTDSVSRQLSSEEANLIYQAMLLDAQSQGTVIFTELPRDCRLYLQLDIRDKEDIVSKDIELYPTATQENSFNLYYVRPDDEHLIEILKNLQIINSKEDLYYLDGFVK